MQRVIYADVLVIINVYITYFLLQASALLAKLRPDRMRLFTASLLGGVYSLAVLLPEKFQGIVGITRFFAVVIFTLAAFGFNSPKAFLRVNLCFILCSFVFAGLMLALWYFVCPAGMYFNGSVLYLDIDVLTLVLLTIGCYAFLKLFERFFRSRAPVNTVFYLKVQFDGREYDMKAFLDTGNFLKDYFTGKPVIIAESSVFSLECCTDVNFKDIAYNDKIRYIFCDTLAGKELLPAFTPENLHIKGADCDFNTNNVTIALTDKKLLNGEYDAILPMGLFENNFDRKDEGEYEKIFASAETDKGKDF